MRGNAGVDIRLARVYEPATNICAKACITYIIMTLPAANGPPAWGLGEVLTTPPCKTALLRNIQRRDACSGDKTIRR